MSKKKIASLFDIDETPKEVKSSLDSVNPKKKTTKASLSKSSDPELNKKFKNSKAEKVVKELDSNEPSQVWQEPSNDINNKFVDIPTDTEPKLNNEVYIDGNELKKYSNTISIDSSKLNSFSMGAFSLPKIDRIPIIIPYKNKNYKIKDFSSTDWIKDMKDTFSKYHLLYMLLIGRMSGISIDNDYYIEINKLEDLLIEV